MTDQETQAKIDAALNAALDDLDDSDDDNDEYAEAVPSPTAAATIPPASTASPTTTTTATPANTPNNNNTNNTNPVNDLVNQLLQEGNGGSPEDEFLGQFLQAMQSQMGAELQNIEGATAATPSPRATPKTPRQSTVLPSPTSTGNTDADIDQTLNSLIEGLNQQAQLNDNDSHDNAEDDTMMNGELDMLKQMMEQLGQQADNNGEGDTNLPDGGFNSDALIDGMMEQLLSKDLMYEPMKLVTDKFPLWLEQHKSQLTSEEYQQRCQQYQCFQKLIHTYDTEPENTKLLMLLMQEVQEFGQPPVEIVKDIAPGLELDDEGVPKMDGMGMNGPLPPFFTGAGAGGDEDCRIM